MESLSYATLRTSNQAREAEEQRTEQRRKNLLLLILHYLNQEGYRESASNLEKEASITLSRYEVCDNIDLETVLQEYESYYYVKFNKYPKVTKKLSSGTNNVTRPGAAGGKLSKKSHPLNKSLDNSTRSKSSSTPSLPRIPQPPEQNTTTNNSTPTSSSPSKYTNRPKSSTGGGIRRQQSQDTRSPKDSQRQVNGSLTNGDPLSDLAVSGSTVSSKQDDKAHQNGPRKLPPGRGPIIDMRAMLNNAIRGAGQDIGNEDSYDPSERLLKPLAGYVGYNMEWRELAQTISKDIYLQNPNVFWEDIIGLDGAKRLVKEAVVYPIKYPQLFTGILSPWKGLLLYGPPGTGKTLLAKAVATECNTTFFNISASSIVSKWRGDSEKLVRVLFELARFHAPSTIFLDELESIMSQRGGQGGAEHEGSRRMKTELLVQMDGLARSDDLVFLLAASNLPWELDHAMLRRLEKRILVDLPIYEARKKMFETHLPPVINAEQPLSITSNLDYKRLAERTEGYSGADIKLVCKEAAMRPLRKIFEILENHSTGDSVPELKVDPVTNHDVESALAHTKPSALKLKDEYVAWQKQYESCIS
ncbi:katanin p60 ATPase-containing subunit A-like 2 isoform X2 [Ptychodera flava]|uniref:katanin p60 ATPase-containing subunit A-like 2 isoform X2 n=1 Tax=Ptychodera flava TaxID=63121 RepID=UPI003969E349